MPRIFKRAAALRDLVEHCVHLEEHAGELLANRFLVAAESSFVALSEHPAMGSALPSRRSEFAALRKWLVRNFDNYLIFYEPRPDGVSIVRVLHATQNWWRLIGVDDP